MDSLPIEIVEIIFMFVNPKDYTNFVLSYNIALYFWRNKKTRERYKEQYLRIIREEFVYDLSHVIKVIRVDNGKNHGKYAKYYENGKKWVDTTYQNIRDVSRIHGKYISYYENGNICIDTTYKNGQIHGKYICYYKNGQICIDTTYRNGQRYGKYIEYYSNGQIQTNIIY
jgi:antitoxin component YwqK of YwqJK toxin-antitoxin module